MNPFLFILVTLPYILFPNVPKGVTSLDIYTPQGAHNLPVILFIHGGGWMEGDKTQVGNNPDFFVNHGYVFVSMNYRLAPEFTYPKQEQDVAAAIKWVKGHISSYGGNPGKIFLIGHSAGATITADVTTNEAYLRAVGMRLNQIAGVILLDSCYDYTIVKNLEPDRYSKILQVVGSDLAKQWRASPISHVAAGKGIPPMLVVYTDYWAQGVPEVLTKVSSQSFYQALRNAGVSAQLYHAADRDHVSVGLDLSLAGDKTGAQVLAFLKAH